MFVFWWNVKQLGKCSKNRVTENFRDGGMGGGGGGVLPFSAMKKSIENWPKNNDFEAKECSFAAK